MSRASPFPASAFKAYDIRGVVPEALNPAFAHALGRAFGARALALGERTVAVGRDGRLSSPALAAALTSPSGTVMCHLPPSSARVGAWRNGALSPVRICTERCGIGRLSRNVIHSAYVVSYLAIRYASVWTSCRGTAVRKRWRRSSSPALPNRKRPAGM